MSADFGVVPAQFLDETVGVPKSDEHLDRFAERVLGEEQVSTIV